MTRSKLVLTLAVLIVAAACGPTQTAPTAGPPTSAASATPAPTVVATVKLTVGLPTIGAQQWPYFVATEKGWYKDAKIDLEQVTISNNTQGVQALISGSIGVFGASPDPLIIANAQANANLVIMGEVQDRPLYSLIVQPEIKSYDDLRGKRLGVFAELSMESAWMQMMLKAHGLNKGDYELVQVGGTAARYAALTAKGIAGTMLTQPQDFQAVRLGYRRLGLSTEVVKEIAWSSYSTSRDFASKNEETLIRFLAVQRKAHLWLYDPKNKDEAISLLAKNTKVEQSDAEQTYQLWITEKSLTADGSETSSAVKAMIDMLVLIGQLKEPIAVDKVFDPSFMEKAKARG